MKKFINFFYVILKVGKCVAKQIRRWLPAWKDFLSASCCKNEIEIGFLIVTLSWGYQQAFQLKQTSFLVIRPPYMIL